MLTIPKEDSTLEIDKQRPEELRPQKGISTFIGKDISTFTKQYGEPVRRDRSAYGYQWWVYSEDPYQYKMVGVEEDKIVTIYALGPEVDVAPFTLGQNLEDIYRFTIIETEIFLEGKEGSYRFDLSEEDLTTRLLIDFGEVFAQVYVDKLSGTLTSVRYMDKETLINLRPYEMVYRGSLVETTLEVDEWGMVELGNEKQIYEITNIVRSLYDVSYVQWDEVAASVAKQHSQDMFQEEYFDHISPTFGSLGDRLKAGEVEFQSAGENIAKLYMDGADAVQGWLNSQGHREALLEEDFTHLGVGVYRKYYTQNFIQKE
ncbi:CAP domain-containing protein [Bacillus sp. 2205SS5-2]|uniref:CAP domain-containing protein n=1 Tax=Bacillus sp. 2205SS5-2 TaxID=3109031 RepID=UPI0030048A6E